MCRPETQKWLTIGTWLSRVYRVASCSCFTSVNFVTQLKGCANWRQSVMTMQECQVQNLVRSRQGDMLQPVSLHHTAHQVVHTVVLQTSSWPPSLELQLSSPTLLVAACILLPATCVLVQQSVVAVWVTPTAVLYCWKPVGVMTEAHSGVVLQWLPSPWGNMIEISPFHWERWYLNYRLQFVVIYAMTHLLYWPVVAIGR